MSLSPQQQRYLKLMDIDVYVPRQVVAPALVPAAAPVVQVAMPSAFVAPAPVLPAVANESATAAAEWQELRRQVPACTQCGLHKERTQTVFGVGNVNAQWMIIGEAPGAEEDKQGEPFVGRAGQLLNAMLAAIGLKREEVFIANILKCRPPKNRDPKPDEAAACAPFLQQQIALVQPRIILALGRIAAQNLLHSDTPIGRMRGQRYEYPDPKVPVVVTYHPAYLLRSPTEKRKAWEDLQMAMGILRGQS